MRSLLNFRNKKIVSWKTSKRLFLVKNQDPVGVNCKIQTKIDKTKEGFVLKETFQFKVLIVVNLQEMNIYVELLEEKNSKLNWFLFQML